jgi:hypothetical protein
MRKILLAIIAPALLVVPVLAQGEDAAAPFVSEVE